MMRGLIWRATDFKTTLSDCRSTAWYVASKAKQLREHVLRTGNTDVVLQLGEVLISLDDLPSERGATLDEVADSHWFNRIVIYARVAAHKRLTNDWEAILQKMLTTEESTTFAELYSQLKAAPFEKRTGTWQEVLGLTRLKSKAAKACAVSSLVACCMG